MKRSLPALAVVVLLLSTLSTAQAVPLRNLFGGGSLTIGDKLFDQFTLNFSDTSDGHVINTNNIDVTTLGPIGLDPLNPGPGLRFSVLNDELKVTGDGVFAYADLKFGFRVSMLDPSFRIKDNSLAESSGTLSPNLDGNNNLGSYILETIGTTPGLSDLSTSSIEFSLLDDILTANFSASTTFAPQSSIWVTKNILVWSQDITDSATLTVFDQRFSQTQVVPESGVLALLGIAGLAGYMTRRRHTNALCSP